MAADLSAPKPWARPLPVLSLRHELAPQEWLDTWRRLTHVLFETGLAGSQTVAVGVLYDYPWRVGDRPRYDACLSVNPVDVAGEDLHRRFEKCVGLRYEVIMLEPGITRIDCQLARSQHDMTLHGDWSALREAQRTRDLTLPLYEVYPCSPTFQRGDVPVAEYFGAVRRSPATRYLDANWRSRAEQAPQR